MPVQSPTTGYAPPETAPELSASAPQLRAAALTGNVSSYELPALPRRVVDQRNVPCCISCALSSAVEALDSKTPALSPMFHYHVTRFDNRGAAPDGFLYVPDALRTLAALGISSEQLHHSAFDDPGAAAAPSPAAYADALTRKMAPRGLMSRMQRWGTGSRAVWVRDRLNRDQPVVVFFRLPDGYPEKLRDKGGRWIDPGIPASATYHCVVAIGYDDAQQSIHVQDSRGDGVFDAGRWWMGYRVLDSSVVAELHALVP